MNNEIHINVYKDTMGNKRLGMGYASMETAAAHGNAAEMSEATEWVGKIKVVLSNGVPMMTYKDTLPKQDRWS